MSPKTVHGMLVELETRYWQAMKDNDMETAMSLTDYPCLVAGPQGVASVDRKTYESMMQSSNHRVNEFEIKDPKVRLLTEDVAVIAYQVHEELTIDGKPHSLDASETSTWVRRDGRWVCAQHSESIAGDPFGRQ